MNVIKEHCMKKKKNPSFNKYKVNKYTWNDQINKKYFYHAYVAVMAKRNTHEFITKPIYLTVSKSRISTCSVIDWIYSFLVSLQLYIASSYFGTLLEEFY